MHIYIYTYIHIYIYTYIHIYIYDRGQVLLLVHGVAVSGCSLCECVSVCVCVRMCIHVCVRVHVCVCVYTYIYIYMYIHIYKYIYIYIYHEEQVLRLVDMAWQPLDVALDAALVHDVLTLRNTINSKIAPLRQLLHVALSVVCCSVMCCECCSVLLCVAVCCSWR